MKKMCFPTWVKYNGGKYPPHTAFEVCDNDVADLQKAGGWLLETPVKETPIKKALVDEPVEETPEVEPQVVEKKKKTTTTKTKKQEE